MYQTDSISDIKQDFIDTFPQCEDVTDNYKVRRRGYVIPEDVRAVCNEVLRHRIGLTYEAEAENVTTEQIIAEVINAVQVP